MTINIIKKLIYGVKGGFLNKIGNVLTLKNEDYSLLMIVGIRKLSELSSYSFLERRNKWGIINNQISDTYR